mmetsp:Transcript_66549/g.124154  ORF Transcript_66549/g.124154 Transcript_66549/m.124154 type:complete len:318 (-) Transcript_66549:120-1073(-)
MSLRPGTSRLVTSENVLADLSPEVRHKLFFSTTSSDVKGGSIKELGRAKQTWMFRERGFIPNLTRTPQSTYVGDYMHPDGAHMKADWEDNTSFRKQLAKRTDPAFLPVHKDPGTSMYGDAYKDVPEAEREACRQKTVVIPSRFSSSLGDATAEWTTETTAAMRPTKEKQEMSIKAERTRKPHTILGLAYRSRQELEQHLQTTDFWQSSSHNLYGPGQWPSRVQPGLGPKRHPKRLLPVGVGQSQSVPELTKDKLKFMQDRISNSLHRTSYEHPLAAEERLTKAGRAFPRDAPPNAREIAEGNSGHGSLRLQNAKFHR